MKKLAVSFALFFLCSFQSVLADEAVAQASASPAQKASIFYYPRELEFWNVGLGDSRTAAIRVMQADAHPLSIHRIKTTSPYLSANLSQSGGTQRRTYSIDVTLEDNTPKGASEAQINILTDHPVNPEVTINVYWNVLDRFVVDPPEFGVRLTRSTRNAGGVIKVSSRTNQPFTIENVTSIYPGVMTDVKPMDECCGYYIAVLVSDPTFNTRQSERSTLVIHTDDEDQKMIVIPLMITAPMLAAPEQAVAP